MKNFIRNAKAAAAYTFETVMDVAFFWVVMNAVGSAISAATGND